MNILVLFGGCSSEYGISLQSAAGVVHAIQAGCHTPVTVGITRGGDWFYCEASPEQIETDIWQTANTAPASLSSSRGDKSLLVLRERGIDRIHIDAVFPVLHGRNGEDGTIQGLCQLLGIPIVGCGTLASAMCMDKDRAHKLVHAAGIDVPRSFVLCKRYDETAVLEQTKAIGLPVFVKPVNAGSSYGVTKVAAVEQLIAAVKTAFQYDDEVIVEEAISGFEVGCAVMGNTRLITGELDEVELAGGFFDFTEKYNLVTAKLHVPARIPPAKAEQIKEAAKTVYRTLGCQGFARVDMFLSETGRIVFNEVNTIPGFTTHSRFPSMMAAVGMDLPAVVELAIELAMEKETVNT